MAFGVKASLYSLLTNYGIAKLLIGFFNKQVNLKWQVWGDNLQIQIKWQLYNHSTLDSFAAVQRAPVLRENEKFQPAKQIHGCTIVPLYKLIDKSERLPATLAHIQWLLIACNWTVKTLSSDIGNG